MASSAFAGTPPTMATVVVTSNNRYFCQIDLEGVAQLSLIRPNLPQLVVMDILLYLEVEPEVPPPPPAPYWIEYHGENQDELWWAYEGPLGKWYKTAKDPVIRLGCW